MAVTWNLRYVIQEMDRCEALVGTLRSQTRRGEMTRLNDARKRQLCQAAI